MKYSRKANCSLLGICCFPTYDCCPFFGIPLGICNLNLSIFGVQFISPVRIRAYYYRMKAELIRTSFSKMALYVWSGLTAVQTVGWYVLGRIESVFMRPETGVRIREVIAPYYSQQKSLPENTAYRKMRLTDSIYCGTVSSFIDSMRGHLEVREDKPIGLWSDRFRIAHVAGTIGPFPRSGKGAVRYS